MYKPMRALLVPLLLSACALNPEDSPSAPEDDPIGVGGTSSSSGGTSSSSGGTPNSSGGTESTMGGAPNTDAECQPGITVTSQLPLLSNLEYENTVSDLFGVPLKVATSLAPNASGSLDDRSWDAYLRAAKKISAEIMIHPEGGEQLLPCTTEDEACAQLFTTEFGKRAFRRPLSDLEVKRLMRLYEERATLTVDASFLKSIELIIRAVLASPSFLTKGEFTIEGDDDQSIPLNDWELASRLSYGLTASMPDAELFSAAEAGTLATQEELLAQAQRLLQTERGRAQVARSHRAFLHMDVGGRWTSDISRDADAYPLFDPAQIPAMNLETPLFFEHVTYSGGSYQDLLTLPIAFVNEDLAPLYGLDAADYDADFVQLDLDPERYSGLLTRIGFLMSHGSSSRTNPIARGAFVQKALLCRSMDAPPNGAAATPLPTDTSLKTNRDRVDAQTSPITCANCHQNIINPVGYAFENFDGIGAYQTTDNGEPVDSSGLVLLGEDEAPVSGVVELMQLLANSPEAHRCYAEKQFSLAYGRQPGSEDDCTLKAAADLSLEGETSILSLIAEFTQAEQFSHRAVGPEEESP